MSGAEDISNLKNSLRIVEGIVDVRVSPSDSVIHVEYDSNTVGVRQVLKTIEVHTAIHVCFRITLHVSCKGRSASFINYLYMYVATPLAV